MKKAKTVIHPIKKPVRRVSNWCLQIWDGLSGKEHRRVKQLRQDLAISEQNEAQLHHQLTQVQAEYTHLEKVLNDRYKELADRQRELADAQKEIDDLWEELGENDQQIQALKTELTNRTSALANCEANLDTVQQSTIENAQAAIITALPEISPTINLAAWKIAFVGGHAATRRVVSQILHTDHGLIYTPVEIPSHREASTSQKQLQSRLSDYHLIVSIVGYSSHSLTKSLKQLKDRAALKGEILTPNSRGATGVVRDILSFVDQNPDLPQHLSA